MLQKIILKHKLHLQLKESGISSMNQSISSFNFNFENVKKLNYLLNKYKIIINIKFQYFNKVIPSNLKVNFE